MGYKVEAVDRLLAKRWIRKSGWSIISLVFPEITVAVAIFENRTAWLLRKEMLKLNNKKAQETKEEGRKVENVKDKEEKKKGHWEERWDDIALSYFVVMGGLKVQEVPEPGQVPTNALPTTNRPDDILEVTQEKVVPEGITETQNSRNNQACTLTPYGALLLAKVGAFRTNLHPTQVRDRSKAGTLAKVIVVLQSCSMAVQVLCRTVAGLTVTILEVHVILHVLCSLCMYIMCVYCIFSASRGFPDFKYSPCIKLADGGANLSISNYRKLFSFPQLK